MNPLADGVAINGRLRIGSLDPAEFNHCAACRYPESVDLEYMADFRHTEGQPTRDRYEDSRAG